MSDFDKHISQQLRAGAEQIRLPAGNAASVMARGRKRQRRFQTAVAGVAFVAGAGMVTGLLATRSSSTPHTTVQMQPSATVQPAAQLSARLAWRVAPATSGLNTATNLSDGTGPIYAVSTAPGFSAVGDVPSVLYRSTDGASWTEVSGASNQSVSIADVSSDGANALYTVGTGPLNASVDGPATVVVSSSANRGATFNGVDLPIDLRAPAGSLKVEALAPEVAAGPQGVVVAVAPAVSFDLSKTPAAASLTSASAWVATPQGIEVLGTERPGACGAGQSIKPPTSTFAQLKAKAAKGAAAAAAAAGDAIVRKIPTTPPPTAPASTNQIYGASCYASSGSGNLVRNIAIPAAYPVLGTYSWGQLAVSTQTAEALQGQPLVFFSTDGKHFAQVTVPSSLQGTGMYLTSGAGSFALATDSGAIESTDGRNWSAPVPLPASAEGNFGAGFVAGRLVLIAGYGQTSAAFILTGSTWSVSALCRLASSRSRLARSVSPQWGSSRRPPLRRRIGTSSSAGMAPPGRPSRWAACRVVKSTKRSQWWALPLWWSLSPGPRRSPTARCRRLRWR